LIAEYSSVDSGGGGSGEGDDDEEDEEEDGDEEVEEEDNDDSLFDLLSPADARVVATAPATMFAGTFTGGRVGFVAETGDSMYNNMIKVMLYFPVKGHDG